MKAKFFESDTVKEIRLDDGASYLSNADESTQDFIERIDSLFEEKGIEAELIKIKIDKYKKQSTKQLIKKLETATGGELSIIIEVLQIRNIKIPVFEAVKNTTQIKTKKLTDVEFSKKIQQCKTKIGKKCQFIPVGKSTHIEGIVKSITSDKRVNNIFYIIKVENSNKLYNCSFDKKTLIF